MFSKEESINLEFFGVKNIYLLIGTLKKCTFVCVRE